MKLTIKTREDLLPGSTRGEKIWNILMTLDMTLFYNFFILTVLLMTSKERFDFSCWILIFFYNTWCTIAYQLDPQDLSISMKVYWKIMFEFAIFKYSKFMFGVFLMFVTYYYYIETINLVQDWTNYRIDLLKEVTFFFFNLLIFVIQIWIWCFFFSMNKMSDIFKLKYHTKIKILTNIEIALCMVILSFTIVYISYNIECTLKLEPTFFEKICGFYLETEIHVRKESSKVLEIGLLIIWLCIFMIIKIINFRIREQNRIRS